MALFRLPTGKPTWLLIRSDKLKNGKDMDVVFDKVESQFPGRIYFMKYDWESKAAQDAITQFSLCGAPATVLADEHGHVIEKFEGIRSAREMSDKITGLLRSSGKTGTSR